MTDLYKMIYYANDFFNYFCPREIILVQKYCLFCSLCFSFLFILECLNLILNVLNKAHHSVHSYSTFEKSIQYGAVNVFCVCLVYAENIDLKEKNNIGKKVYFIMYNYPCETIDKKQMVTKRCCFHATFKNEG